MVVLARLSDAQVTALQAEIQGHGPVLFQSDRAPFVPHGLDGVSADDTEELMTAVLGAGSYQSGSGIPAGEFANNVANSPDLKLQDAERGALASRLTSLLAIPSVATSSKALDLLTEHARVYHSARVLTDLRPVFADDEITSPSATLISHTLKVAYHADSGRDAFYVALDDQDLDELREVIERAQKKSAALKKLVSESGLTLLWPVQDTADPHLIGSTSNA
jgi:hypothetical protein